MPQSLSNILVHIIYSTKDRFPFLCPSLEEELFPYLTQIHHEMNCPIKILNGTADHLHIFCSLARTLDPARLVGITKQHSSKWIHSRGKEWEKFQWQAGYGIFSIGYSQTDSLMAYIKNQKDHHKQTTFQDEYRQFLKAYHVPYDENYVWD